MFAVDHQAGFKQAAGNRPHEKHPAASGPASPSPFRRVLREERAQALPTIALMMVSVLAICGFAVDCGHAYLIYRKLQASCDAAALAGAAVFPTAVGIATATQYAGGTGGLNPVTTLGNVSMVAGYPKIECLNSLKNQGMACTAPANGNAMAVKQQVVIPTYFMRVLGKQTLTLVASSTAAVRGSTPTPYNVAIIMDQTLSMAQWDSNCNATQGACAQAGMQILMQSLSPCPTNASSCQITAGVSKNSVDRVALFVYPNMSILTAAIDYSCTTPMPSGNGFLYNSAWGNYSMLPTAPWLGVPTAVAYTFPATSATSYTPVTATYQLTNFLSDYRTSDKATTLNGSSALVMAAGGASNCNGMLTPNYAGEYGTYYAGALYAAQAALVAEKATHPGSQNVIILLSDGDANSPATNNGYPVLPGASNTGVYPSYVGNCGQAIVAAQSAAAAGTRVYSVAYGSPQTGCSTDVNAGSYPNVSPCQAMAYIASAPQYFFSDYQQSGSNSTCYSLAQPVTSLNAIFTQIANDLTTGRLIPDNTQ